jgi:hypothetical protein
MTRLLSHALVLDLSEVSYVMFVAGEPSTQALYITNCQTTKFITKKAHTITRRVDLYNLRCNITFLSIDAWQRVLGS